jgi:hypothetical protein
MIILLTITAIATWFWPKYGAVHWYNGPRRYISEEEVGNARIVQDPGRPQRPRDSYIRWLNGEGITSPGWPEAVGSERTQAR